MISDRDTALVAAIANDCPQDDRPTREGWPQAFSGDNWYAFDNPKDGYFKRVFWCWLREDMFVSCSDGRDQPEAFRLSPALFDYGCWGIVSATVEVKR